MIGDKTNGERRPHVSIETTEPMAFGTGFIAGLISAILGIASLGAVLAIRFPQFLTYADLRQLALAVAAPLPRSLARFNANPRYPSQ